MTPSSTPPGDQFLDLFRRDIASCRAGVSALDALLHDFRGLKAKAKAIHEIENQGDEITADLFALLHRGVSPPFERNDVIALSSIIDDVLDGVDEVATMLVLYGVSQPSVYLLEVNLLLGQAVDALMQAIDHLDTLDGIAPLAAEVHHLEIEADALYYNAIAELFLPNTYAAIDVIKWKSIFDVMERTVDKCEDVSNVLENLLLKRTL